MTDPTYTAICLIVDRSGSMAGIRESSEDALNEFVHGQATEPGKRTIRMVEFDDRYSQVWPSTPAADCPQYSLVPRGMTALWDAIGRGVSEFGAELAAMPEDQRPGNVLVAIMTDGHENSSHEWTADRVKEVITEQQNAYSWQFLFMGANQDAVLTGRQIGLGAHQSVTYAASDVGTRSVVGTMDAYVAAVAMAAAPTITDEQRRQAMGR